MSKLNDETYRYYNAEWNFSLPLPKGWEVVFENRIEDFPWVNPVRMVGPGDSRSRPYITVVTTVVEESGGGLPAYLAKAERDLSSHFADFRMLGKGERTLLSWPAAWMTYSYSGDSGTVNELNVTAFFGKGKMIWFQFLCETVGTQASLDLGAFEFIINNLQVGAAGIRHPQVSLVGAHACGLCGQTFSPQTKPNAMVNLKLGRLIGVCEACRKA